MNNKCIFLLLIVLITIFLTLLLNFTWIVKLVINIIIDLYKVLINHDEEDKNFELNSVHNIEKEIFNFNMGIRNSCQQLEKDANIICQ